MTRYAEGVLRLIDAARTFVQRVEDGEIRSVKTYNQFRDALEFIDTRELLDAAPIQETHCCEGSRRFGECIHA